MAVENFDAKKLRRDYFSKYFPYDEELKKIIDAKQQRSHDFLINPVVQNIHIYLVEYLLAFSCKWFNKNRFSVLDWGCGKCQVSYLLKKRNVNVISCDIEREHDDSAFGQDTPIADFANIDVTPLKHEYLLPFADETFDVVLSFGVLEHVSNDRQSLIEINRILKTGGLFFCFWLPCKYSPRQKLEQLKTHYHDKLYNGKIKRLLEKTNYNILDYWYRDLLPFRRIPFGRKKFRIMENFDNWLCRNTLLRYFASNIEFVANKKG
ncbi:MAG: class I SAM-dependent methyltransferase [Spirochaetaceae bacterium]|jgi:SAM-dependent methyltransferase|nr:class I SAM-dependent methyltransferase [Spirochaetaceae bacterium]